MARRPRNQGGAGGGAGVVNTPAGPQIGTLPAPTAPAPRPATGGAGGGPGIVNTPRGPQIGTLPTPSRGQATAEELSIPRLDPFEAGRAAVEANTERARTPEELYYDALRADLVAQQTERREGARSYLRGILEQFNLGALAGEVDRLVGETTNELVIMERLRQTEPYRQRFKGLLSLQQRGITDVRNEGQYLELESEYRRAFRESGLRDYLGQAGTQAEFDAIARLVGDFSVSVNEVRDRITDAQRVVANTPQEVRDSLQRFYNIDPATLTQFVLDPQRTTGEIQRRANAAIVGGFAQRAGLDFGVGAAERIGEFLGGERDITGTQIEPQLTEIADIQRSTQRLAEIEQGTLSAETSALAALNLDQEARQRVRTLQSRERARFGGSSAITTGSLSAGPSI